MRATEAPRALELLHGMALQFSMARLSFRLRGHHWRPGPRYGIDLSSQPGCIEQPMVSHPHCRLSSTHGCFVQWTPCQAIPIAPKHNARDSSGELGSLRRNSVGDCRAGECPGRLTDVQQWRRMVITGSIHRRRCVDSMQLTAWLRQCSTHEYAEHPIGTSTPRLTS